MKPLIKTCSIHDNWEVQGSQHCKITDYKSNILSLSIMISCFNLIHKPPINNVDNNTLRTYKLFSYINFIMEKEAAVCERIL